LAETEKKAQKSNDCPSLAALPLIYSIQLVWARHGLCGLVRSV